MSYCPYLKDEYYQIIEYNFYFAYDVDYCGPRNRYYLGRPSVMQWGDPLV